MKYSFFSSALTWLPSALIMAVSASGASSAPLASFVKYVPVETKNISALMVLSVFFSNVALLQRTNWS